MKETLVTISKRTGFAISTVSRVLNGQAEKYRISRKTVELILAEARRCDYTPSLLAKGLRMKRTNTLGLLIPQVSNPYFADIASAIIREARSHGYTVMVVDTMENEENEQEGIRTMLSRRVDGIVAVPCGRTPDHLEKVDRSVPVMLVDRSFERTSLPYVCTDNYRGGVEATRILLQRGHRRIACIQGVPHSMPNRRRVQGYLDALRQAGLQEEAIITGDAFSLENGYRQTKLAVAGPDRPPAIFALSNPARRGQSHPRIGFADPRRYFRGVVRRQSLSGFSGSGHNPHRPARRRDRENSRQAAAGEHPGGGTLPDAAATAA